MALAPGVRLGPYDEALPIAAQIADALDAAHERDAPPLPAYVASGFSRT